MQFFLYNTVYIGLVNFANIYGVGKLVSITITTYLLSKQFIAHLSYIISSRVCSRQGNPRL